MCTPSRKPVGVFSTSTASSKSFAVSPSIVTMRRSRKSRRPSRSSVTDLVRDSARPPRRRAAGNRGGRPCERSTISMSTPGSPRNPRRSSTTPCATRRASGKAVSRASTISPSRAPCGLSVGDPDHGVDLRVVREDDLRAVLRLEPADDALARPLEDPDDGSGDALRVRRRPAARPGSAPPARGRCRRPSRRASRSAGRRGRRRRPRARSRSPRGGPSGGPRPGSRTRSPSTSPRGRARSRRAARASRAARERRPPPLRRRRSSGRGPKTRGFAGLFRGAWRGFPSPEATRAQCIRRYREDFRTPFMRRSRT